VLEEQSRAMGERVGFFKLDRQAPTAMKSPPKPPVQRVA
jgi:hypothetical protein